jgi:hypothetical protein
VGINYFLPLPGVLRALGIAPPSGAEAGAAAEAAP